MCCPLYIYIYIKDTKCSDCFSGSLNHLLVFILISNDCLVDGDGRLEICVNEKIPN